MTRDNALDGSHERRPILQPLSIELPGIHESANKVSKRGQDFYVWLSSARLISLAAATLAAGLKMSPWGFDLFGFLVLIFFATAGVAEFALLIMQPERDWYAGRAIAESSKTLAWRFSVGGEPFGPTLDDADAVERLRTRCAQVLERGKDRITVQTTSPTLTESMRQLRHAPFAVRKMSYIENRTKEQQNWYAGKAKYNACRATFWRWFLLVGEVLAIIIAALSFSRDWALDYAGLIAAAVAGGAAWLAIKQYSQIASAYRIAAVELGLQAEVLSDISENKWPQAVADAEEAISREHTMWLASRGRESLSGAWRKD
jgi:hypothetical protein